MSRSKNTPVTTNTADVKISSTSIYTLLPKGDSHEVNYYVHRNKPLRNILKKLWKDGPEKKNDLATMDAEQEIVTRTNALFRLLEKEGPMPVNGPFKIVHDPRHGVCNQVKEGCVSKGFYHTHVSDKKVSYEVLWECFENKKLINIIAIGPHENFDFAQKGHSPLLGMQQAMEAAKIAKFECGKPFNKETYNNQIYSK